MAVIPVPVLNQSLTTLIIFLFLLFGIILCALCSFVNVLIS